MDWVYQDFKDSLKIEMNYDTIVTTFGEPKKDIGSGIHILNLDLANVGVVTNITFYKRNNSYFISK